MKLGNCIHQLLLENETVIIPGFGAFVSHYKPAELNEDSGTFSPPSKEVSFYSNIRNNDGLLVDFVAGHMGIPHFDALKWIEKERDNLYYQLDKEGSVILDETGILHFSDNHEIGFTPLVQENLLLDSFGLDDVSFVVDNQKITQLTEIPSLTEIRDEESVQEKESADDLEVRTVPAAESGQNEDSGQLKDEQKEVMETDYDVEPDDKTTYVYVTEPSLSTVRHEKNRWWYLLILLPVIFAGIYMIYKRGKIGQQEQTTKQVLEVTAIGTPQPIDTLLIQGNDSLDVLYSVTTDSIKSADISFRQDDPQSYILVGGSFKDRENAETFFRQLEDEGYQPFHLGKRGNFFIVGIGRYTTEKEAVIARDTYMEKKPGSGIWVMKDE